MKATLMFTLMLFCTGISHAQITAVTETGDQVILYDDGTWEYIDQPVLDLVEVKTNPQVFKKGDDATFSLKSTRVDMAFWLDPAKWSFEKAVTNEEAEYELMLRGEDLYGMIITEKVEVPLTTLKDLALENAKLVAPDAKVINEEYRTVNGLKVLLLQINGTTQGIKFSYYGYYYSNSNGTVQFITYTSQNLMEDYKKDAESLLNGMVELR